MVQTDFQLVKQNTDRLLSCSNDQQDLLNEKVQIVHSNIRMMNVDEANWSHRKYQLKMMHFKANFF